MRIDKIHEKIILPLYGGCLYIQLSITAYHIDGTIYILLLNAIFLYGSGQSINCKIEAVIKKKFRFALFF